MSFLDRWFSGASSGADRASSVRATNAMPVHSAELRIEAGMTSDVGCVRTVNEDALRIIRPTSAEGVARLGVLAVVCDGMGGHEGGEIASRLAMETIVRRMESEQPEAHRALVHALRAANRAIYDASRANATLRGMGTTCCALLLRGGLAYCSHVGDSRLYLMRAGQVFLMTEDHSAVMDLVRKGVITREEARHHPDKNVISRALGGHKEVEVSAWKRPFAVLPRDTFLLCSDGLHDLVHEDELLETVGDVHAQVACDRLVALARERGGHDNVSVAILRMRADAEQAAPPRETRAIEIVP